MKNYTNTFAQPGKIHDDKPTNTYCSLLDKHVLQDLGANGRLISPRKSCKYDEWKVCGFLISKYGADFHFYREERTKQWSHKYGSERPTQLDASGRMIDDVITADKTYSLGEYDQLCGCYCVSGKVNIK